MNLRKNKYLLVFLAMWGILLIVGSLISEETEPMTLVISTGFISLVAPLLYLVSNKVGANAPAGKTYSVHRMGDGRVVCRVEGIWIYRGTEEKATWYMRGKKVFAFTEKEYLYRVEGEQIFRRGEEQPCMLVRGDTIYRLPDNEPLYQTAE